MSLTTTMTTPSTTPQQRCSKRKRNQIISYNYDHIDALLVENDEDLDMDMDGDQEGMVDTKKKEEDESYSQSHKNKKKKNKNKNKKHKTTKEKPQPPFPFLNLPAELRNKIYEYCLVEPSGLLLRQKFRGYRRSVIREDMDRFGYKRNPIDDDDDDDDDDDNQNQNHTTSQPTRRHLVPALLATNRQIHTEASSILYNQPIHVKDTTALHTFISSLRPGTRRALHGRIVIHEWAQDRSMQKTMNHAGLTALADCPNLRHVVLACWPGRLYWPSNSSGDDGRWRSERAVSLARQLYRDGFLWMRALGRARARRDAVVEVLRVAKWDPSGRTRGVAGKDEETVMMGILHAELRRLIEECK